MSTFIDEVGHRYGQLLVLYQDTSIHKKHAYWVCRCDCGNTVTVDGLKLRSGHTKSCGCLREKHGYSQTSEYSSYQSMMKRCYDESNDNYPYYGGRGIKVCDRWREDINNFMQDMGQKPDPNYSIDRIDPNGDYTPENCRWSNVYEQQRNKRVCKKSRTGVTGVIPYMNKFQAYIRCNGKLHHLGYFDTVEEAAEARKKAEAYYWGGGDAK